MERLLRALGTPDARCDGIGDCCSTIEYVRALAERGARRRHRPCTAAMSKAHDFGVRHSKIVCFGRTGPTHSQSAIIRTKTIQIHEFRITIKTEITMNNVTMSLEYDGPINAVNRANTTKNIPGKHSVYH